MANISQKVNGSIYNVECIEVGTDATVQPLQGTALIAYPAAVTIRIEKLDGVIVSSLASTTVNNQTELEAIEHVYTTTEKADYQSVVEVVDANSQSFESILTFSVCDPFGIKKTSTNNYTIHKPWASNITVFDLKVYGYGEATTVFTKNAWDINVEKEVNFTVPGFGIYIVEMLNPADNSVVYSFVIWENDQLWICVKELGLDIYCNPGDPCCENCNDKTKAEIEERKQRLTELAAVVLPYLSFAYADYFDNAGLYSIDQARKDLLDTAKDMRERITEMLKNCKGLCTDNDPVLSNITDDCGC